ncbi:MAG: NUDIX domain-containing protein, partial [Planctomycetota bacterium]
MSDHSFELLGSERAYEGRRVSIRRDRLRGPDGREYTREIVEHPGAAVVVPFLDDGRLLLVRQYRHPIERAILEAPAGTLEPGEDPAACASRELEEETGYRAGKLERLGTVYPSPGVLSEVMHVFCATELAAGT